MMIHTRIRDNDIMDMMPPALTNDNSISGDAKILWVKLWNSNKGKKKKNYKIWKPKINGLATQFGVERTTILRWKKELDDTGWITTVGSRNATKVYVHLVANKQPVLVADLQLYTYTSTMANKSPTVLDKKVLPSFESNHINVDTSNKGTSEVEVKV